MESAIADPNLWERRDEAQKLLQRRRQLETTLQRLEGYRQGIRDLEAFFELAAEGEPVESEIDSELRALEERVKETEIETLLSGPHDHANAIVTIHPGAGGTESQDWAEMLLRMYLRWAERRGWAAQIVDYQPAEEAGLKSVTFTVQGENVYGYFRSEIGVHRLVRISPFDANARRHTSFASVFVTPDIEDEIDIVIEDKDLKIDTYRSSGAGGQHVNVTDSAVRITHLPSGIIVQCQNERSQHRNRDTAMKILKAKLYEKELEKKRAELERIEDGKADIAWGSQIRSYVLHPYRMAKDHRTKLEIGDVDRVLDGDLDPLVSEYLQSRTRSAAVKPQPKSEPRP